MPRVPASAPASTRALPPTIVAYYTRPTALLLTSCDLPPPPRLKPTRVWYISNVFGDSPRAFAAYSRAFLQAFPLASRPKDLQLHNVKAGLVRRVGAWLQVPGYRGGGGGEPWDGGWPELEEESWEGHGGDGQDAGEKDARPPWCDEAEMSWARLFTVQVDARVRPWVVWTLCLVVWSCAQTRIKRRGQRGVGESDDEKKEEELVKRWGKRGRTVNVVEEAEKETGQTAAAKTDAEVESSSDDSSSDESSSE
ncbi:hypothetical protein EDC01DRAFT_319064 [Geopyxis carbonaria]|nr:hypothetical protein EDC01DRAFT_319064 [Geopyxis carbonaria]